MNVLIISGIFPPDTGGPATYVPKIATALHDRGHSITVVTTSEHETDARDGDRRYTIIRLRRNRALPVRFVLTIATLLRVGRHADVLFANGLYLESAIANMALRKPLVLKIVGDWAWERARNKGWTRTTFDEFQQHGSSGPRVAVLEALRSYASRSAHAVIVPSRFLGSVVERWGVLHDRVRVIYNGAELAANHHRVEIPLQASQRVISVGRLVPWKHVDQLIHTMRSLPDDVGLIVVGDGPQRSRLEDLTRDLGVAHRVWFAGTREPAEVTSLLSQSDVFVLNSSYEGLPHVVIEAMLAGVPVIATAAGGTGEAVTQGDTGLLIPAGDTDALLRAILELLHDSEKRRAMAARARTVATARFSTDAMIGETEATLMAAAARWLGGQVAR